MPKMTALVFPASDENLLTIPEAAERLGIAAETLKRLAQQRQIPSIKLGRLRRFEPAALRAYIAQHRVA